MYFQNRIECRQFQGFHKNDNISKTTGERQKALQKGKNLKCFVASSSVEERRDTDAFSKISNNWGQEEVMLP